MILLDLVLVCIGIWAWMCRNDIYSERYGKDSGWWREHLDIVGLLMLWHHGSIHPEYEDFTLMDDEPTQEERNAGPMVWNQAPPKEEIIDEQARRAYRDWNISACAPRRAPDLVRLGFARAH